MSELLVQHEAHKARLARMGGALPSRVIPLPKVEPLKAKPPKVVLWRGINPAPYWRNMWFWDLINFSQNPDSVSRPAIRKIAMEVSLHYRIPTQDMIGERRTKEIVRARQVAMCLARRLTLRSLTEIGRYFGGRDHTTVLHGANKIERLAQFPEMRDELEILTGRILAP